MNDLTYIKCDNKLEYFDAINTCFVNGYDFNNTDLLNFDPNLNCVFINDDGFISAGSESTVISFGRYPYKQNKDIDLIHHLIESAKHVSIQKWIIYIGFLIACGVTGQAVNFYLWKHLFGCTCVID